jgi:hypothetical protein
MANPAPTPTTTPRNSCGTTTRFRKQRSIPAVFASKVPKLAVAGDQCQSWS